MVFDLTAGLIVLICVASALFGLFPWADQVPHLSSPALVLFLVPYLATWLTMRLVLLPIKRLCINGESSSR